MDLSTSTITIIAIILLIVLVVFLSTLTAFEIDKPDVVVFPGIVSDQLRRNCDVETVYSMSDGQCSMICKPPGIYRSHNGVCVNVLAFDQEYTVNKCSPTKGVFAYLLGDPQFGKTKMFCLSIDPGIQPDDVDKPNTICDGGEIDINYLESFPNAKNCRCPADDQSLVQIANTAGVRIRGVCANRALFPIFAYNKLVTFAET